jgi:hypothetical protein
MRKVHLGRELNDYVIVMVGESTAERRESRGNNRPRVRAGGLPDPRGSKDIGRGRRRSEGRWGSGCELLANNEVKANPANFDEVAVIEANGSGNGRAVDGGNSVASTKVIAVVALVDLCRHFGFEPSA